MRSREYKELVARALEAEGYRTELRPYNRDLGVDVFVHKDTERLAVQAKMYAAAKRKVNHECVMQLHGAAAYFDCTGAVLATDSVLTKEASLVAQKLNIRILKLAPAARRSTPRVTGSTLDFDAVWERYVMPLAGKTLHRKSGETNTVVSVDWAGLERITSSGNTQFIKIEIFRYAIERILSDGTITREDINQRYAGRASSGITLVLAEVPLFEVGGRPQAVRLRHT